MNTLCNSRFGRICLHLAAMAVDHQFRWHLAGIGREVSLTLVA
jgi:hypothetical protein